MKNNHEKLISSLVDELEPIGKSVKVMIPFQLWLLMAALLTASLAWFWGPYRVGTLGQLVSSMQFSLETVAGCIAILAIAFIAFQSTIPASASAFKQGKVPLLLLGAWVAFYLYGLVDPALIESKAGKRDHCYLETMLLSTLPLIVALLWAKTAWPTNQAQTGLLFGLASGAIAAMVMQFSCMYDPVHALVFHVLPGLLMGVVGIILARKMIKSD
jgi:hypothetical protein